MVHAGGMVRRSRKSLERCALSELPLIFGDWIDLSLQSQATFRERLFTPSRTFWLFLSQAFSADGTCDEAVRRALAWVSLQSEPGDALPSASTSAYCQARARLPQEMVEGALEQICDRIEEQPLELWLGHRVKITDGTTFSMPDTPENQEHFGQPTTQKQGCGFPMMRAVCMFCLSSGALLARKAGSFAVHERTLWRELWGKLEAGDVVLADRGFCGYADLGLLLGQDVDCVMRLHSRRSVGVRELERLGKDDHLVEWIKSGSHPDWIPKDEWQQMPDKLIVRHVSFKVAIAGFRTQVITIATTLLDPKKYPAKAFAQLYLRRWQAELCLRDLKITMGMDALRCKTPAMILKELDMHLIAYNLIRAMMLVAASSEGLDPHRLSFKQSMDTIRQWAPAMVEAATERRHQEMLKLLLYYLTQTVIPHRPGRSEPRAVKKRPKNYQRLTAPRKEFKAMPHRNRYKKP